MGIKESAIKQFGRQAEAYSKGNIFVDEVHLSEVVKRSGIENNHTVLDIATGAGFLALEFAKKGRLVYGCDLTRNMLLKACEKQKILDLDNTGFLFSDVESLPFPDGRFDIVSCRFAFHHFPDPEMALHEMKRVSKKRIIIVDGVSSEDNNKSLSHNRIEKIRDPSHVRIYQLSEIKTMLDNIGATVFGLTHWDIPQDFEEWIRRAGAHKRKMEEIKGLMRRSIDGDDTGLRVKIKDGKMGFTYDTVILIIDITK